MKKTRYSDEQIVWIFCETDKDTVAEVVKRHSVSEATIYAWRKKFGSMEKDEVKRLKALEVETARLRKLLVDWELEIDVSIRPANTYIHGPAAYAAVFINAVRQGCQRCGSNCSI